MTDMEYPKPDFVPNFPEGLDEARLGVVIQHVLNTIDRDRLFKDHRLYRVQHPLLIERLGKDVALNVEVHNIILDVARPMLSLDETIRSELFGQAKDPENILLAASHNPEVIREAIKELRAAVGKLAECNVELYAEIEQFLSYKLREKLTMPKPVQEMVLYPTILVEAEGMPRQTILEFSQDIRRSLLAGLNGADAQVASTLRDDIEREADFVRGWYEKNAYSDL